MSLLTARVTSSANAVPHACRVFGMWVVGGATNGTVVLNDPLTPTGTGGTARATFDIPGITTTGTTFAGFIPFSGDEGGEGIQFQVACAVALTTAVACTLIYRQTGL